MSDNKAPYGYCPRCGAPGVSRERRPNGYDTCRRGHMYPSKDGIQEAMMYTWNVGISSNGTTQFVDVTTNLASNAALFGPMSMFLKRQEDGLPEIPTESMTVVYVARQDLFG